MKSKILILLIIVLSSCQEKETNDKCESIERKYDSILNFNKEYKNTSIYKFHEILNKEKGTSLDTILINDYKNLIGRDSLINLYIWDRIHSINQKTTKINIYEDFKGTYLLKPNHNKKYAQATKIIIDNDSCYLYKNRDLIISNNFKLTNSSNKYIKGKIILKNYRLYLDGAIKSKLMIHLDDNVCMDCEQLQFYKIN
jgi:hypothetical protein